MRRKLHHILGRSICKSTHGRREQQLASLEMMSWGLHSVAAWAAGAVTAHELVRRHLLRVVYDLQMPLFLGDVLVHLFESGAHVGVF